MVKILFLLFLIISASGPATAFPASHEAAGGVRDLPVRQPDGILSNESSNALKFEKYTCPGCFFRVTIPASWEKKEEGHPYGDLTKIRGIRIIGPKNSSNVPVAIFVLYYSGEGIFLTYREYIISQLNSMVRTDYDRETVIEDVKVAGRAAKRFQVSKFELVYLQEKGRPLLDDSIRR